MKIIKKLTTILFALMIIAAAVLVPRAAYAKTYKNGTYKVAVELSASGMNHNKLLSPASLTVSDGKYYIDLVFKRVKGDGAPQYTSMTTACGTFTERSLDESAQTCTFKGVQIPEAGDFDVTTVTEAMSQPYEVEYTISVDASGIPEADEVTATTSADDDSSNNGSDNDSSDTATAVASSDGVTLPEKPTAPLTPEESSLAEEKEAEEEIDIADTLEEVLTIGALEEEDTGLGTGAIIGIVAGSAVLIAAAVVIIIKIKKK